MPSPAQGPGAAVAQQQASTVALAASATLSDAVGFDIMAGANLRAEVIPGVNPSFRWVNGWTAVTRVSAGHYCINGGAITAGAITYDYPAVVSVSSDTLGVGYVPYDSHGSGCTGVGVWTRTL